MKLSEEDRVRHSWVWVFLALYLVIGGLGAWAFWLVLPDPAWFEIFVSVWWAPAGLAAWFIRWHLEAALTPRSPPPSRR